MRLSAGLRQTETAGRRRGRADCSRPPSLSSSRSVVVSVVARNQDNSHLPAAPSSLPTGSPSSSPAPAPPQPSLQRPAATPTGPKLSPSPPPWSARLLHITSPPFADRLPRSHLLKRVWDTYMNIDSPADDERRGLPQAGSKAGWRLRCTNAVRRTWLLQSRVAQGLQCPSEKKVAHPWLSGRGCATLRRFVCCLLARPANLFGGRDEKAPVDGS